MKALSKPNWLLALGLPAIILVTCIRIALNHEITTDNRLATAITLDLCVVAPALYFLFIRKSTVAPITTLRVFLIGVIATGLLLIKGQSLLFDFITTWVAPVIEFAIIGFAAYSFYTARKKIRSTSGAPIDFFSHLRNVFAAVIGHQRLAHILAGEISLFYYVFVSIKDKPDGIQKFSIYKTNGILLILGCFLGLFIIETTAVHFLLQLWNKTLAWVATGLSAYTCFQLYGHMRAIKARPVYITEDDLVVRNGLFGGEASIAVTNIEKIALSKNKITGSMVQHLSLLKAFENHNVVIYLKEKVIVTKAFGQERPATIVLLSIDQLTEFGKAVMDKGIPLSE